MSGNDTELSSSLLKGAMGFHMNAFLALVIVVGLIFVILFFLERLKHMIPRLLKNSPKQHSLLSVNDVIRLDQKRKLISVSVENKSGKKALAVLLVGGGADVCVGWLEEDRATENVSEQMRKKEEFQKDNMHV
ncbi:hypothetical protein GT348_08940 (plasmid) [Aristophania vespae]|uniref:Uncharacterized protein n=1 Tax=Aristophania vespae TaxID=2697033 RepID=A0A6P1NCT7_9PROT|nr:hypothetical protein [Aristophania vespae]QHI96475.1 hypothetical protein GT348_08940 [Aristophania vespae]UMM64786.1 hypothetical protein DM15PD_18060 [Aristophania vespae]